jgi:transcriptional antiterminator
MDMKEVKRAPIELFRQMNESEVCLLNKLKRKIFFVSATLTREFKGQKYKIKRNH